MTDRGKTSPPRTPSSRCRHRGLSTDEHQIFARKLYGIRSALMDIVTSGAWPKTSAPARAILRLLRVVDATRCELDNELARTDPFGFSSDIYYPSQRSSQAPPGVDGSAGASGGQEAER